MNLLPPWAVDMKRRRLLIQRLAAIQVFVFALCAACYWGFGALVHNASITTAALARVLSGERFTVSDAMADRVKNARARADRQAAFIAVVNPTVFDVAWLRNVNAALPQGTDLLEVTLDGSRIRLTCAAADWHAATVFRDRLLEADLYAWVRFGEFTRAEDGRARYTLYIEAKADAPAEASAE